MERAGCCPSWRFSTIAAVALSLSVGWGVRGNFGHEYGAMLPGVLAALAACILSGRRDWIARAPYFAFFGALGWAFGGSMSYMKVVSYTESGHLSSQLYGFFGLFAGGFLWAAMGGAGISYAAVEDRECITALFRPLCWVFAAWTFIYFCWVPVMTAFGLPVQELVERGIEREMRQNDPFYWLDTDWVQASFALAAVCAFDLWSRRFHRAWLLPICCAGCASAGWALQWLLTKIRVVAGVLPYIVRVQGDLSLLNPETNKPFDPADMVTNWPVLFTQHGAYAGAAVGILAGAAIYFAKWGELRSEASLLAYMTIGWLVSFLAFPVLLGIRMTPPRNDNWAGVVGVLAGLSIYMYRNGRPLVIAGALVTGTIGGFGIAFTQLVKIMMLAPGNASRLSDLPKELSGPVIAAWEHWHSANWHSIAIEQGAGVIYGIGAAVAVAILSSRTPRIKDEPRLHRWTDVFSVGFVLCAIIYLSMIKLVTEYTKVREGGFIEVPLHMRPPLFAGLEFSSRTWFNFFFALYAVCVLGLLIRHLWRRVPIIPEGPLGKAQLLYVVFLWIVVVFNQIKAQAAFHEQRLGTEGVIFVNAVIATVLVVSLAREQERWEPPAAKSRDSSSLLRRTILAGIVTAACCAFGFAGVTRLVYRDKPVSVGNKGLRFGPNAEWRLYPVLRDEEHR